MIVDFHTHLFPPEVIRKRRRYVERDPAFARLYGNPAARLVAAEEMLEAMDREGVDRAVVFGFPWSDPGLCRLANDYTLEAQQRHPERFTSLYTPALDCGPAQARAAEEALDRGMNGIGEVAFYLPAGERDGDLCSMLGPLAEAALHKRVPFLLHVNEPVGHAYPGKVDMRLGDIWRFAAMFPELKLVLAHWGGGLFFFELMKSVRQPLGSLYYDTAASPYLYDPRVYRIAMDILGAERILFGSDYPLIPPSRYFREMERAGLSVEEKDCILGQNAMRLLGISENSRPGV